MPRTLSFSSSATAPGIEDEEPMGLSELLRTGEASRLRRRGAITGAHGRTRSVGFNGGSDGSSSEYQWGWGRLPTQAAAAPPPLWSDNNAITAPVMLPSWSSESEQAKADEEEDSKHGSGYSLYCGYEEWDFSAPYSSEPYEPSPIPLAFSLPSSSTKAPPSKKYRKSTGCGALLHTNAIPRTRYGTWHAKGKATDVVVPLNKRYFERGGLLRQYPCGCRYHNIGCTLCGNALGYVYQPCQASTVSNAPQRRSSRSASSRSTRSSSAHESYGFYCNAVTPSPVYNFPECCLKKAPAELPIPPPPIPMSRSASSRAMPQAQATLTSASLSRDIVIPPSLSLTDSTGSSGDNDSDYTYGGYDEREYELDEPGIELDPNGVLLSSEPGSPDKPSNEAMLWPAR